MRKEKMKIRNNFFVTGFLVMAVCSGLITGAVFIKKFAILKEAQAKEMAKPLLLQVKGKVILLEEEGKEKQLVLVADSGKKYILTGENMEELEARVGQQVKVLGKVKRPGQEKVNDESVRFILDVLGVSGVEK